MATLLRTATSTTSKLIAGIPAQGTTLVGVSGRGTVQSDSTQNLTTVDSLQTRTNLISQNGPFLGSASRKGVNVSSRRFAHTDVNFPNFDGYRRESTLDPTKPARETEDQRRVIGVMAGKEIVQKLVTYKAMAADQKALASIEIDLSTIPLGQTKTFEWRGKPVFVKHRTEKEIAVEKSVTVADLRHPEHDNERVQKDEWLVVIGVCTHLGCIPIANAGDFSGMLCPCHFSHYDGSGRIRKGPAPLNLHVPPYSFKGDSMIVVGSE
uniref:Cytochrome b-c1 complex subunit Rieske, mitochondrial n=1 Tax=Rhabditophanes sp. KR3021 TaxID=114890 RepID=A0AC35TVE8_9BILA